jgi:hypothetical protein
LIKTQCLDTLIDGGLMPAREPTPLWVKVAGAVFIVGVVVFAVVHLTVGGLHNHGGPEAAPASALPSDAKP